MCLMFVYLNTDPGQSDFRLVIASNRDENWVRPTDTAKLRGEHPQWLGGMDLEHGKEGGTWLGLTTTGKFGSLLNILTHQSKEKKGRGNLVKDFLCGDETPEAYLERLAEEKSQYNPFQLVLVDLREPTTQCHYLENNNSSSKHETFPPGVYSFDNSDDRECLWQKSCDGRTKFRDIVGQHGVISQKEVLLNKLTELLCDKTQFFPDKQLQKQFFAEFGMPEGEVVQQRSARFVFSPLIKYGTRTNTLILVDFHGNCDYIERTLDTPVIVDHPTWTTEEFHLQLDLSPPTDREGP